MTSKQEKLAAARKKLKEFQVKNKEVDHSKQKKPNDTVTLKTSKEYSCVSGDSKNSPLVSQNTSPGNLSPNLLTYQESRGQDGNENQRKISSQFNQLSDQYGSREALDDPQLLGNSSNSRVSSESPNFGSSHQNHVNIDGVSFNDVKSKNPKDFFNTNSIDGFDDVIKPLQNELDNHAQTINILVQQKNEVQSELTEARALLDKKSGEIGELNQRIVLLTTSLTDVNKRLKEAEEFSQTLQSEKEEYFQKWKEALLRSDKLQVKLESEEEEFLELKKKYEDKSSESQRLLFSLQETQSQLSLTQIQAQQFSTEGQTTLAIQISDLQKENLNLKEKLTELEKSLESERIEKDESSQKFHVYAQQCNLQLANLNSQLQIVQAENKKLIEENATFSKKLSELGEEKEKDPSMQSYETEIADLHDQLSALKEKNNCLEMDLSRKKEESIYLKEELEAKDGEINQLETIVKEVKEENKKLITEAETPKANERLLATMESDKVAAAKAVSQNVKLKEQIVELEEAFVKLSQEKLKLTDELAREKHLRSELDKRLQHEESDSQHDHSECHNEKDKNEPLVNDSNEIEELRNIVRQLQDDKMELTARLSAYETNKTEERTKSECEHSHNQAHTYEHNETECENYKIRLQQMEEKVMRTMNELAILDEEKEKLEHLVWQLQGETETIGEYIALYQRQRMMLRQRAHEKDIRLLQLSRDKEELRMKLEALDELIQRLIAEGGCTNSQSRSNTPPLSRPSSSCDNTADKIRDLITDIETTNLIANQPGIFEHCPCCSGRLITV